MSRSNNNNKRGRKLGVRLKRNTNNNHNHQEESENMIEIKHLNRKLSIICSPRNNCVMAARLDSIIYRPEDLKFLKILQKGTIKIEDLGRLIERWWNSIYSI